MQRYIKTFGIWRPLTDIDVLERINIFPHFFRASIFFVFLTSQVTLARIPAVQVGCFWSETAVVVGKGPMDPPEIHLLGPLDAWDSPGVSQPESPTKKALNQGRIPTSSPEIENHSLRYVWRFCLLIFASEQYVFFLLHNIPKMPTTHLHPRKLTNRYQKLIGVIRNCISGFKIFQKMASFWVLP